MNEYLSTVLRYRPAAGWWDLLDIAIVSILIYEFLKLIRGTRAAQMAVGSLLIVAMFYVSRLAPLQTLNWMIRNALVYVAFAAILIFQSDIRRALAARRQGRPRHHLRADPDLDAGRQHRVGATCRSMPAEAP